MTIVHYIIISLSIESAIARSQVSEFI